MDFLKKAKSQAKALKQQLNDQYLQPQAPFNQPPTPGASPNGGANQYQQGGPQYGGVNNPQGYPQYQPNQGYHQPPPLPQQYGQQQQQPYYSQPGGHVPPNGYFPPHGYHQQNQYAPPPPPQQSNQYAPPPNGHPEQPKQYSEPNGYHQQPAAPQSQGHTPPITPPAEQASSFNMSSISNALPSSAPRAAEQPAYQGQGCPKHEVASLELYPFYIFEEHTVDQRTVAFNFFDFGICGACFSQNIARYPNLAAGFKQRVKDPGVGGQTQTCERYICQFALPRVRMAFYNECVPQNSLQPLVQYARLSATLAACTGAVVPGVSSYYTSRATENMAICDSCFETHFRKTAFERELYRSQPSDGWQCDVGLKGFVFKSLVAELANSRPDLQRFGAKVQHRLMICCLGSEPVWPANQPIAPFTYEPPDGSSGIFCEACFLDKIHGSAIESQFNKRVQMTEEFHGNVNCNLDTVASKFAMDAGIKRGDGEVWRRCLTRRHELPLCANIMGLDEEKLSPSDEPWYYLKEAPAIEICPICQAACVELLGAGHLFAPIQRPLRPGIVRMCFLSVSKDMSLDDGQPRLFDNTLVWRGTMLRRWIQQGYDAQNDFIGFQHAAKMIAAWEPPCGMEYIAFKPITGRKWFGNQGPLPGDTMNQTIVFCEECFNDFLKDTDFGPTFCHDMTDHVNARFPNGNKCALETRRTRDKIQEAIDSKDLASFVAWFGKRWEIGFRRQALDDRCEQQAVVQQAMKDQIDMQNSMGMIQHMQRLNANTNAIIMGVGGSVSEAASADYGQRYGNPSIGYNYLTPGGATAAQARVNAINMPTPRGPSVFDFKESGDTWADTQRLIALRKAVEEEWKEVE